MLRLARDADLRQTMGAAAKERYQKLFSPKVVVPLMVETYRRVIRGTVMVFRQPSRAMDTFIRGPMSNIQRRPVELKSRTDEYR